ncbi:myosin-11-like isoform X2 [Papaver somniferum]|uniref:myosin-11-like isoform X2 n=1 Tax=Papaver somniferum TaxID=3469 RepID=UPI000E703D7A|nr:myosin-11-like isoform X2 [Papaver somniferum]
MKMKKTTEVSEEGTTATDFVKNTNNFVRNSSEKEKNLKLQKRKVRNLGVRLKKDGGKRSGPVTPLLKWKIDDKEEIEKEEEENVCEEGYEIENDADKMEKSGKKVKGKVGVVSARKLAAGLWKLQKLQEVNDAEEDGLSSHKKLNDRLGFEAGVEHVGSPFFFHSKSAEVGLDHTDFSLCAAGVSKSKNENQHKVKTSFSFSNSAMEGATKWDPGCSKTSDEVFKFYGQVKLLEDQHKASVSVVSSVQAELERARNRIHELEMERQSTKKQFEHIIRNLKEEKTSWRSREHEKVRAIIDDMKDELTREKKNRQRLEIVNSKLVNELTSTKRSTKHLMHDYEKERKNRQLMEEVCDELAKEIGEDKAEVEALKRESNKIREEVEEERRMLQMAEVWREERVQMKLLDAKLILEQKYSQLNGLMEDLDRFLSSRTGTTDSMGMREAAILRNAVNSVNIQDVNFSYEPPNSEDIFSVFEELQHGGANEREIQQGLDFSPKVNEFKRNSVERYSNGYVDHQGEIEEDGSGWETVSHVDQGSSYSPEGSELSVDRSNRDSYASGSVIGWKGNGGNGSPNSQISEICSSSPAKKSKKKASSISRLWRSNPRNSEKYKIISVEGKNEKISNGRVSNVGAMNSSESGEGGFSSPSMVSLQWSSPDLGNPQMKGGTRGSIERKKADDQENLKAKFLEARLEVQRYQGAYRKIKKQQP